MSLAQGSLWALLIGGRLAGSMDTGAISLALSPTGMGEVLLAEAPAVPHDANRTAAAAAATFAADLQLAEYSWVEFNKLPDFADAGLASRMLSPADLQVVGAVFHEFGVAALFGLSLLHKHFDLLPGERVVETITGNVSVSVPVVSAGAGALPSRFKLTEHGGLVPLEFSVPGAANVHVGEQLGVLRQSGAFVRRLAATLRERGLLHKFGLGLRHRAAVALRGHTTETSSGGERRLTVRGGALAPALQWSCTVQAQALWTFDSSGECSVAAANC